MVASGAGWVGTSGTGAVDMLLEYFGFSFFLFDKVVTAGGLFFMTVRGVIAVRILEKMQEGR